MGAFEDLGSIGPLPLADGYLARAVHGERLTLAVVEIEPGAALPAHEHANEQLGLVLEGSVVFRVGDETRRLGPGGTWCIPGGTPHAVTGGDDGAVVVDVFSPPRDDWAARESGESQPPPWPPAREPHDREPLGGDQACWAHLVCPECGAVESEGHRPGCPQAGGPGSRDA